VKFRFKPNACHRKFESEALETPVLATSPVPNQDNPKFEIPA
jgi:hypothetical protein